MMTHYEVEMMLFDVDFDETGIFADDFNDLKVLASTRTYLERSLDDLAAFLCATLFGHSTPLWKITQTGCLFQPLVTVPSSIVL